MKLKITKREKNLILILIGILFLAASYYLGYSTLREEAENLKRENKILERQIQALEEMEENKGKYATETKEMQQNMNILLQRFPADIISEDIILYVRDLENKADADVNHVTVPGKKHLEIQASYETDVLSNMEDITGAVAEYGFVNKGTIPKTEDMRLVKVESDITYSVTYKGLKRMIREIVEDEERKSVDNISLVFNENTGNLAGNMTINYFALSGTGKEYEKPVISGMLHGTECIFGDLSSGSSME